MFGMGIELIETTDDKIKHICDKCTLLSSCKECKNIKNEYMYCAILANRLNYERKLFKLWVKFKKRYIH